MILKMKKIAIKDSKGFALLIAIIVSALLVTIGAILTTIAAQEVRLSTSIQGSLSAFYASESGVECAKYWSVKDVGYFSMDPSFRTILCNGVTVDLQSSTVHSVPASGSDNFQFSLDNSSLNNFPIRVNVLRTTNNSGTTEVITSSGYNKNPDVLSTNLVQRLRSTTLAGLCTNRVDLMLTLDSSSSIDDNANSTINSPTVVKAATSSVINLDFANHQSQAGLITFSDYFNTGNSYAPFLAQTLTGDANQIINSISTYYHVCTLKNACDHENTTNVDAAISMGMQELQSLRHRPGVPQVILLVTDGEPHAYVDSSGKDVNEVNKPYTQSLLHAQSSVNAAKAAGIKIIVVGINTGTLDCPTYSPAYGYSNGDGVCSDWLRDQVASSPQLFYPVTYNTIVDTLSNITQCTGNLIDK
jgi:hypothetical protein